MLKDSNNEIVNIDIYSEQMKNFGSVYKEGNSIFFSVNVDEFYNWYGSFCVFGDDGYLYPEDIPLEERVNIFNESFDFGLILMPIRYKLDGVWRIGILRLGKAIQTKVGIEIEPWEIKNLNDFQFKSAR